MTVLSEPTSCRLQSQELRHTKMAHLQLISISNMSFYENAIFVFWFSSSLHTNAGMNPLRWYISVVLCVPSIRESLYIYIYIYVGIQICISRSARIGTQRLDSNVEKKVAIAGNCSICSHFARTSADIVFFLARTFVSICY